MASVTAGCRRVQTQLPEIEEGAAARSTGVVQLDVRRAEGDRDRRLFLGRWLYGSHSNASRSHAHWRDAPRKIPEAARRDANGARGSVSCRALIDGTSDRSDQAVEARGCRANEVENHRGWMHERIKREVGRTVASDGSGALSTAGRIGQRELPDSRPRSVGPHLPGRAGAADVRCRRHLRRRSVLRPHRRRYCVLQDGRVHASGIRVAWHGPVSSVWRGRRQHALLSGALTPSRERYRSMHLRWPNARRPPIRQSGDECRTLISRT